MKLNALQLLQCNIIGLVFCYYTGLSQCHSKVQKPEAVIYPRIDTVIYQLKSNQELAITDLIPLNVIDTVYTKIARGEVYCDTSVQVNENIFFSIILIPEASLVSGHYFVLSMDEKNKKAIAAKYLHENFNIDYTKRRYTMYEYKIVDTNIIQLTKSTIVQTKDRISFDEDENIEKKIIAKEWEFIVKYDGQIIFYEIER